MPLRATATWRRSARVNARSNASRATERMSSPDHPVTMAVRVLRQHQVAFVPRLYKYVEHGGTRASAEALGLDEHAVIKTLIFEDDQKRPLCILMHGDREVSAKNLAR